MHEQIVGRVVFEAEVVGDTGDLGTADTPALPMRGLSFLFWGRNRLKIFTNITPDADAMMKAMKPRAKMKMVSTVRNDVA